MTSCYGVRCYNPGSFLLNHVDRTSTHVLSAIVNVYQEGMLEDWPLEIYDHAGQMHRVPMQPGDIVLYESAKNTHGKLASKWNALIAHHYDSFLD